jgi:hypothetical protein
MYDTRAKEAEFGRRVANDCSAQEEAANVLGLLLRVANNTINVFECLAVGFYKHTACTYIKIKFLCYFVFEFSCPCLSMATTRYKMLRACLYR